MSELQKYLIDFMHKVLDRVGGREAGSRQEKIASEMIEAEFSQYCDETISEPFVVAPRAFLGFLPWIVVTYWISLIVYWKTPLVSLLIMSVALVVFIEQFVLSHPFLDPLYKKSESRNLTGVIKPSGEVRQRLFFNAHVDSAYEFTIWYIFKGANIIFMIAGVLAIFYMEILAILKVIFDLAGHGDKPFLATMGYIAVGLVPFTIPFLFFVSKRVVPGASDDLSGIAAMIGIAKRVKEMKNNGQLPKHTEIRFLALGSEEAGLRGSIAYVRQNSHLLKDCKTYNVTFEGIEAPEKMRVITHEFFKAKHSKTLENMLFNIAKRNDWFLRTDVIPFGGTDASTFTQEGVESTCLLGMNTQPWPINYHTRRDTMEYVTPEGLERAVDFGVELLKDLDAKAAK